MFPHFLPLLAYFNPQCPTLPNLKLWISKKQALNACFLGNRIPFLSFISLVALMGKSEFRELVYHKGS